MRRKRFIQFSALILLAAGVLLCWPRGPKEPVFEGRKLGYWIRQSLASVDPQHEEQAERAVKTAGTNALPYLLDQFTQPQSRWVRILNRTGTKFHTSLHLETEGERISVALFGLSALGRDAAPALPVLATQLGNPDPQRRLGATVVMIDCGDKALPFLRNAIASTNSYIVCAALVGLDGLLAGTNDSALPLVVSLLSHSSSEVRRRAFAALGNSRASPAITTQELMPALGVKNLEVQLAAMDLLGKLGPAAKPAVPALLKLMTHSNAHLARAASNAVLHIDPSALPPRQP